MTPDEERWAEALQVERMYGDRAALWIAERIGGLALVGDAAVVQRFWEIAARFELLLAGSGRAESVENGLSANGEASGSSRLCAGAPSRRMVNRETGALRGVQ